LTPLRVFNSLVLVGLSHFLGRFCATLMLFGSLVVSMCHITLSLPLVLNLVST
jgi:hypothetical protein